MVVGSIFLFEFFGRLSGVDAFEDGESSEIFEGELEFADGFGFGDVLGGFAFLSGFGSGHYKFYC